MVRIATVIVNRPHHDITHPDPATKRVPKHPSCCMARPERFELPTTKFVAWCSIQLSYGRNLRDRNDICDAGFASFVERVDEGAGLF